MTEHKHYCMVRVEKIGHQSVSGRCRHVIRGYDDSHHAPTHIDEKLSRNNLYIGEEAEKFVEQEHAKDYQIRIDAAKREHKATTGKNMRKDASPAYELVMARSDLGPRHEDEFDNRAWFRDSVNWAAKRFGAQNVVGAAMHMDERDGSGKVHPHIHIVMIPRVLADKGSKLSFGATFGLGDYRELQTQYATAMQRYGLKRGEQKTTPDRHIKPKEFRGMVQQAKKLGREIAQSIGHRAYRAELEEAASENYVRTMVENQRIESAQARENQTLKEQIKSKDEVLEKMRKETLEARQEAKKLKGKLAEANQYLMKLFRAYDRGMAVLKETMENLREKLQPQRKIGHGHER